MLDHFDAVKIGLTATPALHTTEIFGRPVFTYSYREAVLDGRLTDHEPPYQLVTALKKPASPGDVASKWISSICGPVRSTPSPCPTR